MIRARHSRIALPEASSSLLCAVEQEERRFDALIASGFAIRHASKKGR